MPTAKADLGPDILSPAMQADKMSSEAAVLDEVGQMLDALRAELADEAPSIPDVAAISDRVADEALSVRAIKRRESEDAVPLVEPDPGLSLETEQPDLPAGVSSPVSDVAEMVMALGLRVSSVENKGRFLQELIEEAGNTAAQQGDDYSEQTESFDIEDGLLGGDGPFRFQVTRKDDTNVSVREGWWTRNGSTTVVADQDINIPTDDTYYILGTLSHASKNPEVVPDTLALSASTTLPSDYFDIATPLAIVVRSGGVITSVVQLRYGGDIDDYVTLPDSETSLATSVILNTLSLRTNAPHERELVLYGFEALTSEEDHDDQALYADIATGGPNSVYYQWPVQVDDGGGMRPRNTFDGSAFAFDAVVALAGIGAPTAGVATGQLKTREMSIEHAALEIGDESGAIPVGFNISVIYAQGIDWSAWDPNTDGPAHDQTDPRPSGDPHDEWLAQGSQDNPDHDDRYFQNTASAVAELSDFTTAGYVYATELSVDGGVVNTWNTTILNADVSGGVTLVAATTGVLEGGGDVRVESTGGNLSLIGSANVDILAFGDVNISGGVNLDVDMDAVQINAANGAMFLGATTTIDIGALGAVTVSGSPLNLAAVAGDITATPFANFNLAAGVYEIGGNEGATVADGGTNWWEGGIFPNDAGAQIYTLIGVRLAGVSGVKNVKFLGLIA